MLPPRAELGILREQPDDFFSVGIPVIQLSITQKLFNQSRQDKKHCQQGQGQKMHLLSLFGTCSQICE